MEITQDEFDSILVEMLSEMSGDILLSIPGVYEILAEELNNDVLSTWQARQEKPE